MLRKKANVAMIKKDVEEMDKAIKEIDMDIREFKEYGIPGMERVVKNLSSRWELLLESYYVESYNKFSYLFYLGSW